MIPKSLIFHYFLLLGTVGFIDKVKQSDHYDNNVQNLGFLHYAKHSVKVSHLCGYILMVYKIAMTFALKAKGAL